MVTKLILNGVAISLAPSPEPILIEHLETADTIRMKSRTGDIGFDGEVPSPIPMPDPMFKNGFDVLHVYGTHSPLATGPLVRLIYVVQQALAAAPQLRRMPQLSRTTAMFGIRDDGSFAINLSANQIEFRSASRVGYSDLNVNSKRME